MFMHKVWPLTLAVLAVLAAGCGGGEPTASSTPTTAATPSETTTPTPTAPAATSEPATAEPTATPAPTATPDPSADPTTRAPDPTGGDEPPVALEGAVTNRGVAAVEGGEAEINADDIFFEPTFVSARPGQTVMVKVKNEGGIEHTFTIESLGIDEVLAPDAEITVEVALPDEGPVNYFCRFHSAAGMQGAFFFEGQ